MGVLNAADSLPKDIHEFPVGGRDVRIRSNYFALRCGGGCFSSEVEKLKWSIFDLALKLALYTKKTRNNAVLTIQCVLPTTPSLDGMCRLSVLESC